MKITIKKEVNAKYIAVAAGVRYWEDATINGVQDVDGKMPCRSSNSWCPVIDVETGKIDLWTTGVTANISYKVSDQCSFNLLDENFEILWEGESGYVPKILSPAGQGYGDYIYMSINQEGFIEDWGKLLLQRAVDEAAEGN
jgi:hypothetical protein